MSTAGESQCFRCKSDCTPISNISSDDGVSFICIGYNTIESRAIKSDRFTKCWKNDEIDECSHWDKRDLLDTMSVISHALSIDENIRINEELTDDEMNEMNEMNFVNG